MPKKHAFLSASSSYRWLACPPSSLACAEIQERASPYARQGTDAHSLCEYKVSKALGLDVKNPTEDLEYFDAEMDYCSDEYCNFVMEQYAQAKKLCSDPLIMLEERLDFSQWVPEGFGTGDCVIVADRELHIIDYKHGLGILVESEENPQLKCYALGAIYAYDGIYDIETVKMSIFQPRRDNVGTTVMGKAELLKWAENTLAPTAQLAMNGGGEYSAGEHCQFCKIKATCRKRAEYSLEMARYDFEMPTNLDPHEIASILPKIDALVSWANDIMEYALRQALCGVKYPGYKVVEGKSNRRFIDDAAVAAAVENAGFDPYEKKLLGITAMTSLLGEKKLKELLGGLITKPPGKPTLVSDRDRRPAMNTAIDDFKEK